MLLPYGGHRPELEEPCFIAPGAQVIGQVKLGRESSVWFNAVVRADEAPIAIGAATNLQDGVVAHTDRGIVLQVGNEVTVGHRAILHGCRIGDRVLVGMGAIILNGAEIGHDCLIAAGALVPEDRVIPPGSLVMGVPGRVVRTLSPEEMERIRLSAQVYIELWKQSGWQ
jgi:carbonic anhydrase/acetyltransferase-like protein (isoleucine patch superfamily)